MVHLCYIQRVCEISPVNKFPFPGYWVTPMAHPDQYCGSGYLFVNIFCEHRVKIVCLIYQAASQPESSILLRGMLIANKCLVFLPILMRGENP